MLCGLTASRESLWFIFMWLWVFIRLWYCRMLQFASGSSLYGRMVQELYCFIFTSNGPGENIYILKFIQKYEEVVEVVQACNMWMWILISCSCIPILYSYLIKPSNNFPCLNYKQKHMTWSFSQHLPELHWIFFKSILICQIDSTRAIAVMSRSKGSSEGTKSQSTGDPETDSESIVISFEIKVKHLKKAVRKAMVTKKKDKKENKSKKKKESKAKGSRKETRNRGPRQRSRTRSSVRTRSASVSRTRSATRFVENRLQGLKKNVYGSC